MISICLNNLNLKKVWKTKSQYDDTLFIAIEYLCEIYMFFYGRTNQIQVNDTDDNI